MDGNTCCNTGVQKMFSDLLIHEGSHYMLIKSLRQVQNLSILEQKAIHVATISNRT